MTPPSISEAITQLSQLLSARGLNTQAITLQQGYNTRNPLYKAFIHPLSVSFGSGGDFNLPMFFGISGIPNQVPPLPNTNAVAIGQINLSAMPLNTPQDHNISAQCNIIYNAPGPITSNGISASLSAGSTASDFESGRLNINTIFTKFVSSAGGTINYDFSFYGVILVFPSL